MKITIINGSPNAKGSCSLVIKSLLTEFTDNHQISNYQLNNLNTHGCQECFACRNSKTDKCYINDDLSQVLDEVKFTDLLILASPIFYADLSAQVKCFIDRTWSFFGINGQSASHLPRNRKMIFILSYGYTDSNHYNNVFDKYEKYFNMFGFSDISYLNTCGAQYFNNQPINKQEISHKIKKIVSDYSL